MHRNRNLLLVTLWILVAAGSASAQDPPPISVLTFDREFVNWASAQEREFEFPDPLIPVEKITLRIRLDCPSGGCDPWDRSAYVFVRGRDSAGRMEKYEIARFITPYGRGCSWEVDVTDYRIFLAGEVSLGFYVETWIGGEQGWLVTLTFDFYEGTPERDVLSIENLWGGKPEYGNPDNPIEEFFAERDLEIHVSATGVKLRFSVTGHGQGNTDNAAEFARKLHGLHVGADRFDHYLWRDDCDRNPCSPQGGTWQFARAGWCPGDAVEPWDVDLSGSIVPGGTVPIRYEVEPYTNRCRPETCVVSDCPWGDCEYDSGSHTVPHYWVESQAITYGRLSAGNSSFHFQQGRDGYSGTVDTMLLEASAGSSQAADAELSVDGDDGTGHATQALIRFDDIFGDGPGQIPRGAPIRSARLLLSSTDAGDGAALHRLRAGWSDGDTWATFGGNGIQAGVETLPEPDGLAEAEAGGVVSADVTAALAEWSQSSCPSFGWALLPTGDDGWRFSSSEGDDPPRLVVETRPLVDDARIAVGDEWLYFKGTRAPPVNWNQPDFVPGAGWLTGATGIGYDDDDDTTILDDMRGSYPSVFCRREFQLDGFVTAMRLCIDYDDGFAAFLNGIEVARSPSLAPPGVTIAWNRLADDDREAGEVETYDLPLSALTPGTNVLAIEVHNTALDSSDLSLLPALLVDSALVPPGARWRFLRGDEPLPADWSEPGFDDSSWEEGPTGIGYGDDDDVTRLIDMRDSYGAVFCRHAFDIDGVERLEGVAMRVLYDDGIIVFANGMEVARINMPAGPVSANLFARSALEPEQALVSIPVELLNEGRNVLAVSVHNAALDSSDLSFDPVLFDDGRANVVSCDTSFRRGDADADGLTNVTDAVVVLTYLFIGGAAPGCLDACDANDTGTIDLTDGVYLLGFLFLGGPPPPEPFASCGPDPTGDTWSCRSFPPCGP